MTVQISYKNKKTKNNAQNLVLFVDEKFNVSSLKKHISVSDYAFIADLIKKRDEKKKIISFDISSKKKIILISSKNNTTSSDFENLGGVGGMDCHGVCFGSSVIDSCGNCTAGAGEDANPTNSTYCMGNMAEDMTFGTFETAGIEYYTDVSSQSHAPDINTPTNSSEGNNWFPGINCLTYEDLYGYTNTAGHCIHNWAVDSCGKCYGANTDIRGCCLDDIGETISDSVNIRGNTENPEWNTFPEIKFSFTEFEPPKEKLVNRFGMKFYNHFCDSYMSYVEFTFFIKRLPNLNLFSAKTIRLSLSATVSTLLVVIVVELTEVREINSFSYIATI